MSQLNLHKGLSELKNGALDKAQQYFLEMLKFDPNNFDALNYLGIIAYQKSDFENALSYLNCAYSINQKSTQLLNNIGLTYSALFRYQDALKFFDLAIELDNSIPETHNNRGNALKGLDNKQSALKSYQKALALRPSYAQAINNMGVVFLEENDYQNAVVLFKKAVSLNSKFPEALNNLGNAWTELGQYEFAFQSYELALNINPHYIDAIHNFGNSFKRKGLYKNAIKCYSHALSLDNNLSKAKSYSLLGDAYYDAGENELAINSYLAALKLEPNNIENKVSLLIAQIPKILTTSGQLIHSREKFLKEAMLLLDEIKIIGEQSIDSAKTFSRHPFYLAYHEQDNKDFMSKFGIICHSLSRTLQDSLRQPIKTLKFNKIRIGIISNFFNNHPVWHAITKGLVLQLNKNLFEIFLFNTNGVEDTETEIAKSKASNYINLCNSTKHAAQLILNYEVDALIFPEVGMDPLTKSLACLRLAPLQIVSWGHPDTTGIPNIDLYLSAEMYEKNGAEAYYSETLLKLPNLGTYITKDHTESVKPDLEKLNIDQSVPILICAGSPSKYLPQNDDVFIEIAKKLKQCNFIFFNFQDNLSHKLEHRLINTFSKSGLDYYTFVKFISFLPKEKFFGLMQISNVYLDTIGFSGFNTAMQAIICDLPIVTIEGKFMRGRLASGILNYLGLHKLVCHSKQEYINLAVALSTNKFFHSTIKGEISTSKSRLFYDITPIRALESYLVKRVNQSNGQ